MHTEPIRSQLTPTSQTTCTEAAVETFKITDIPAAMDTLSWHQSARLMRKWFNGAPHELPKDVKLGKSPASKLNATQLMTDLPFDWLMTSSDRVKPKVDEVVDQLSVVREFDGTVGRLKAPLDQLSKGLIQLMTRLKRLGLIDEKNRTLRNDYLDFSNYSAIKLEETSQFNWLSIGASTLEKATDELDDVYGALGSFIIKVAASKIRTMANDHGYAAIRIEEIGLYVRDTYDFLNAGADQLLGYWSKKGVLRPGVIDYFAKPDHIDADDVRHFKVTNGSFNSYRKKFNKGGDFVVFSTVKHYPTSIIVHLSPADFDEFASRAADI